MFMEERLEQITPWLPIILFPLLWFWFFKRNRPLFASVNDAVALLREGQHEAAAAALEGLCHRCKGSPGIHAWVVANRAEAYLWMGDAKTAASLFFSAIESR